jgi:hypothetical protein
MNCPGIYLDLRETSKRRTRNVTHDWLLSQELCACAEVMSKANSMFVLKLEGKVPLGIVCLEGKLINSF